MESHTRSMDGYRPLSFAERRASMAFSNDENTSPTRTLTLNTLSQPNCHPSLVDKLLQTHLRGPPTPNMNISSVDPYSPTHSTHDPPPPPTPAASPGPDHLRPDWSNAGDQESFFLAKLRVHFTECSPSERTRILADLLNICTSQQLSFVRQYVDPLLKKNPFTCLPTEICLRILSCIDDPKVLARASQVSHRWHELLADDVTWKNLCAKHNYRRRVSENVTTSPLQAAPRSQLTCQRTPTIYDLQMTSIPATIAMNSFHPGNSKCLANSISLGAKRSKVKSYKSHFKHRYMVESAWRTGGQHIARNITQDQGVVTSLHLTPKYIVVALDNAKIHVFNIDGNGQKTLVGHVMGVWAIVPWDNLLVSGGCDRDVRVWDMSTGESIYTLRGHTSTVRCLKMFDSTTAISGSRDTTLRVWDIKTGLCKNILVGHQSSVRCLEIKGDIVVSGSYDATAKVWSISEGRCLQTLAGHYSQIYAIAFDGERIATGSLDTSVRIWNPHNGTCQAILQGHTSLVGQIQMRGDTLVSGGSDGSVRVWSLEKMVPIHRLAAHDNSVTSLQFDETRVVSGGSDGRVKVWDLKTGQLIRELTAPADAVWRVAFEEEKCVVMASRSNRTIMEVWSFSPPEEILYESDHTLSYSSSSTPTKRILHETLPRPQSAVSYIDSNTRDLHMTVNENIPNNSRSHANWTSEDVEMIGVDSNNSATYPSNASVVSATSFFRDD